MVIQTRTVNRPAAGSRFIRALTRYRYLYLLLIPGLTYLIVFCYLPMVGLVIAFQDYKVFLGISGSKFVGFANFERLFLTHKFMSVLANTFIINSERLSLNSDNNDERWTTRALLTTTTNLELTRNESGTALAVAWQVIQNNSAAVQPASGTGSGSIILTATSATAALSPAVNLGTTFLVFSKRAGGAIAGDETQYQVRGEITNGTTATFFRARQTGLANTGTNHGWSTVQMNDGSTVQRGTATPAGTGNTVNVALSPAIVPSRSLPIISVSGDAASLTPTGDLDDDSWTAAFTSCTPTCTNLQLTRGGGQGSSTNATIAWFVVQFATSGGSLIDKQEIFP